MIAGWTAVETPPSTRQLVTRTLIFAAIAVAPDLDLLVGRHRSESHSIGAVVVVASLAALMRWPVSASRLRIWIAVAAAWGSHLVLDAVGTDMSPPRGVMAFWPVSSAYIKSSLDLFLPISRQWQLPGFLAHTATAVAVEIVLLGPWLCLIAWWRWPRRRQA